MSEEDSTSFGKVVDSLTIDESTEIRIQRGTDKKGKVFVNIRKFVNTDRYSGPTKQGIRLSAEEWEKLIPKIQKASK